jgi:hypothetical protein
MSTSDQIYFLNPNPLIRRTLEEFRIGVISFKLTEPTSGNLVDLQKWLKSESWNSILLKIDKAFPVFARRIDEMQSWGMQKRLIAIKIIELLEIIKTQNVKILMFPTGVSHHPDNVCAEIACEILNVKQIFFYLTPISEKVLVSIQTEGLATRQFIPFRAKSEKNRTKLTDEEFSNIAIRTLQLGEYPVNQLWRAIWKYSNFHFKHSIKELYKKKFYVSQKTIVGDLELIINFKKSTFMKNILTMLEQRRSLLYFNIKTEKHFKKIEKLARGNAGDEPIICLFAHFQPEASTFVEGGEFNSHLDVVASMRSSGIVVPIVYKEHPGTFSFLNHGYPNGVGTQRSKNYYKALEKMGCLFTQQDILGEKGIPYLAATISGSVAIERSLKGMETLYFGMPWWAGLPGTSEFTDRPSLVKSKDRTQLAKAARTFLIELFHNSSMTNHLIHIGNSTLSNEMIKEFEFELKELIDYLRKDSIHAIE